MRDVMTIPQAAEVLQIGTSTAYALARSGKLPVVRIGSQGADHPPRRGSGWSTPSPAPPASTAPAASCDQGRSGGWKSRGKRG